MKKIIKTLLWIFGTIIWLSLLTTFIALEIEHEIHALIAYLIITGICLTIYIFRKTSSSAKDLEKENQALKTENQKLRQELEQAQAVQRAMDAADSRERKN